jgi:DNA-binding GntR family transcriptional regulator
MRTEASQSPVLIRTSVYGRIRGEILSCVLRPGAMLQERELAERYAVSKSPIRDALLRLEEQSLVEVLPRKGYRVKPVSIADARVMYEMRQVLERACVVRLIESAGEEVVAELARLARAPRHASLGEWIDYNRRFHLALAEGCGNARLARATSEVVEQFDRLTMMSVTSAEKIPLSRFADEHAAIVTAIRRRDKRAAAAIVRHHIDSSRRRLMAQLESQAVVP